MTVPDVVSLGTDPDAVLAQEVLEDLRVVLRQGRVAEPPSLDDLLAGAYGAGDGPLDTAVLLPAGVGPGADRDHAGTA